MKRRPDALRTTLALLLVVSAIGFTVAARAERRREAAATAGSPLPEGSAAREAAERATPVTSSTTVATDVTPTSRAPVTAAPTTANPLTAAEGSAAREAAERARSSPTTLPPTTSSPTTAPTPTVTTVLPTTPTATAVPARVSAPKIGEKLFGVRTESVGATSAAVVVLVASALLVFASRRRWILLGVVAIALVFALLDVREAIHQHDEHRASLVAAAVAIGVAHLSASALGLLVYRRSQSIIPVRSEPLGPA